VRQYYEVETSDIREDGSFQCPQCRRAISANDGSDQICKTETWTIAEGTIVVEVNLRCQCGSMIRLEGSEILKATGFAKDFGDSDGNPDGSDCWLEWLDALEDNTPRSSRPRSSIPFWD